MGMEKKLTWIESLRGIAAILVFISHLRFVAGSQGGFVIGRIGVVLFFLITGYLAIDSRRRKTRKQYTFNRFCRMYPVYWALLLLTFALGSTLDADYPYSIRDFVLNMTLFHEFAGSECIIGANWMMPIQVCFFAVVATFGANFWTDRISFPGSRIKLCVSDIVMTALALLAVLTGYLRFRTGIPFPSAFFLLLSVAFLGMYRNQPNGGGTLLAIFEVELLITAILSYRDQAALYVLAYNAGIVLFSIAERRANLHGKLAMRLGGIGFTFFLSAFPAKIILASIDSFDGSIVAILLGYAAELALTLLIAEAVDKWIERPFLRKAKEIEGQLN